jgi:hypothetical protein
MSAPAAPAPGRRASFGATAVLAGFLLLAPPLYLLGPFALLTLLSRPRSVREILFLALAGAGIAAALSGNLDLGSQILRASALVLAGVFALLNLRPRGPVFPRALAAVALTGLGLCLWAWAHGIHWQMVQQAFTDMLRTSYRAMADMAGPDPKSRQEVQNFVQQFVEAAPDIARAMPGLLALEGLAGLLLAWRWHHRIAGTPLGVAPAPFREFRFNDHFVWGAIFTLGLLLVPLPPAVTAVAINLLIVWMGLYAMRGLAIVSTILAAAPGPLKLLAAGLALLLLPLALGACLALGLADVWLNVRGRFVPRDSTGA